MTATLSKTGFGTPLAVAALAAAGCFWMASAQAQDRPPMGQGPGMGGPGMGMSGPGMGGPGGVAGPGMMRMGPPPILTATDKYVYVLRGETLYQFSADGLKLLAKSELPRPEPRDPHDGKSPPRK